MLEFSSVLRPVMGEGEDRELEPGERRPGNRLWPGEKSGGSGLVTGGWKAEGKDLRMGASPGRENIGKKSPSEKARFHYFNRPSVMSIGKKS